MSGPVDSDEGSPWLGSHQARLEVDDAFRMAKVFFHAATKLSENNEDILPQEDGEGMKLSVFSVFASLFPDTVGSSGGGVKNKRMRLHFNKIGYQMYGKEQSRRVPSLRAKPGNPGYGFRRARWRDTLSDNEDRTHCQSVLQAAGCSQEKIKQVMASVQECRHLWDAVRRPSRPAGPGRPRRVDGSPYTPKATPTLAPVKHDDGEPEPEEPRQDSPAEGDENMSSPASSSLGPSADSNGPPPLILDGMEPPSPGMKRMREGESLSSMAMLTLKKRSSSLLSPGPMMMLDGSKPLLPGARSQGGSMLRDLTLPPLALPPMARAPSTQPLGSLEAEMARSPATGAPVLQMRSGHSGASIPSLSALEFLAHAAAAAAEEQRELIPLAPLVLM